MLIISSETVAGKEIEATLGLVRGSTVRSKHIGSDILAGLRNIVGGEVKEYASLLAGAREQATDRMIESAQALGADAIVSVRYQTSNITQAASEVLCYGTAVKFK